MDLIMTYTWSFLVNEMISTFTAWSGQILHQLIILERSHLAPICLVKLLMKRIKRKRKMHPTNWKMRLRLIHWYPHLGLICCLNIGSIWIFIIMDDMTWLFHTFHIFCLFKGISVCLICCLLFFSLLKPTLECSVKPFTLWMKLLHV